VAGAFALVSEGEVCDAGAMGEAGCLSPDDDGALFEAGVELELFATGVRA
jgi:hypothetical protein